MTSSEELATPIPTPCIKVCIVDGASGLCLGCLRSLPEIAGWSGFAPAERERIMGELEGRRKFLRDSRPTGVGTPFTV